LKTLERVLSWPRLILASDSNAGRKYDLWGQEGPFPNSSGRPVVNMGYWEGIRVGEDCDLERASNALFELVARHADFSAADRLVLDVGCGFGTNAILCAERFQLPRVVGVNVSGVQVAVGRRLVAKAELEDRVELLEAGATELPFDDASVDKIVSVEAAFHFPTRERFFAEAARVLKPGGVLSMVDLCAPPPKGLLQGLLLKMLRHALQVPAANIYAAPEYLRRVEGAGLELLETESLYSLTFPPFRRWLMHNVLRWLPHTNPFFALASGGYFFYPWEYLRLKARKAAA
jgi:SAM-dependent methyltransferase